MDQLSDQSHHTPFMPLVATLTPELTRHLGELQCATRLIQASLEQSCMTHCLAAKAFADMVETAQQIIQASAADGRLTPLKEAALHHLTLAAMYELLVIVDDTDAELLNVLTRW